MAGNPFTSAQAPAAMQLIAPDLATQQNQIARQQQYADILKQQALTPIGDTQVIGGWAVRRNPLEAVAKMAQALMGNHAQYEADQKQLALSKALQGRVADVLNNGTAQDRASAALSQGAAAQPSTPDDTGALVNQGGVGPTVQNAARMDTLPQPTQNNFTMGNLLKGQVISNLGGEAAGSAYWDQFKPTEGMKTDKYLGIAPAQSRQLELAKRLKEGTMSLQPGQTNLLPDGSRFVAPNFETGVAGGFDQNGNPIATEIKGSTAIAENRARATAAATAGAQAQHKLVTVNTQGGPVMMTEEQAAQLSGGGAPQGAGVRLDNPNGPSLDFKGNPQAVFDRLSKLPEPDRTQALAAFGQYAKQPAGGAVGIPLKTPAQEAQELADVKARNEPRLAQNTKEATDMADYKKALDGHLSDSQALLQRIAQSREALTKFRAGGGGDTRVQLAQWAQAIPGMPTSIVDKIAGGDLSAAQEFQKYAAQEALGTMQQALASDTGKGSQGNRIAMQLFIKNNPNLDTDPRAIEKIFNFQTQLHNQMKAQSDAYQKYVSTPGNNPSDFPNWWATEAIKRGFVKPEIKTGYAKGVPPEVQAVLDKYK